jgi:hypothetical protein
MMTKAKFKIGDRLKVVQDPDRHGSYSDWFVGDYMTVEHVVEWPEEPCYWISNGKCGLMESDVELAALADSPLWKALE